MNCVVTAGPTHEPLDEARRITNFSTGRLGSQLAARLSEKGHQVILLKSRYAISQGGENAQQTVEFTTAAELRIRLQEMRQRNIDAVFHAAAVSDFGFGRVWTRLPTGDLSELKMRKLTTRCKSLLVELIPTPKIIGQLRQWFPQAWLVGWKYEIDGDRASALAKARLQIEESSTNACVANGPAYGDGFGFVSQGADDVHLVDRTNLFELLATRLVERSRL